MAKSMNRPELDLEKLCYIIIKARELDVQEEVEEVDEGSNAIDDGFLHVLEANKDDATLIELKSSMDAMNEDEQAQLVALAWIGRGDFDAKEWPQAVELAKERHSGSTADYLIGIPMLGDLLEEGLSAFGLSCRDTETAHL